MLTDTFGFYTRKVSVIMKARPMRLVSDFVLPPPNSHIAMITKRRGAGRRGGWVGAGGGWLAGGGGGGPGSGGSGGVALAEGGLDPVDDVVGGSARREDLGHAHPLQFGDVGVGDDAAAEHGDIRGAAFGEQFQDPPELGHVRAGQNRQPDRCGVLLERGGHDLLRGLVQPGVDHLYPGVTKRPRHDLGPPVVSVQAGLGDDDPDGSHDFLPRGCAAGWPPPATYPCYEAGRRRGG